MARARWRSSSLRKVKTRWESYNRAANIRYGVPSSLAQAQVKKVATRIQELER